MEAAGDHQMQDQPDVVFKADGDALADAAEFADRLAFCGRDGRLRGAQKERRGDADVFEALVEDAALDGGDVGGDVGQLRHGYQLAGNRWDWQGCCAFGKMRVVKL